MTTRIVYEVTLTVHSPFLFHGLANAMFGVDAAQLRDEDGKPVIPSDQIRGVLKEALLDLAKAAPDVVKEVPINELFGEPSPEHKNDNDEWDRPDRGTLFFSDLTAEGALDAPNETTRIEIDDTTGAVKTGHVQVIELVAPFGKEMTFRGKMVAYRSQSEAKALEKVFAKALGIMLAIGAFKSAGFGEIVHEKSAIRLNEKELHVLGLPMCASVKEERRAYWVTFDRPILADAARVSDNTYLGSAIIPGAMFKGALAKRLEYAGEAPEKASSQFSKTLTQLRISHAWPETKDGLPSGMSLPLSLVGYSEKDSKVGDALHVPYGKGAMFDGQKAAIFGPDWKDDVRQTAMSLLNWPVFDDPLPLPRTHTAIKDGQADEGKLYTTVARSVRRPAHWSKPGEARRWLLIVDGGKVDAEAELAKLFTLLEDEGLEPLGKTNARARFQRADDMAGLAVPSPVHGTPHQFAVVLKTPALMADPLGGGDARAQYESYFEVACPGAKLINFFASQRFAGGYLATRRRPYGNTYYPFVLTEAGSVFLLEAHPEKLSEFIRYGLPLPKLKGATPLDWRNCPFVRENGFGEITADYLSKPEHAKLLECVKDV